MSACSHFSDSISTKLFLCVVIPDRHAWWFTNEETKTYSSKEFESKCFGFEESVKLIESVILEKGPFDGIVGFSQGACFLSLLCCLQQHGSKI